MATSNFGCDEVLGVIALNTIDFEKDAIEYYNTEIAENEEEKIEYLSGDSIEWDWYYQDWQEEIKELNNQLNVLEVELESGYYESAMLRLHYHNDTHLTDEELSLIINARYEPKQLTSVCRDIDCYYWSISPSEIFNDYDILKEWINKRLKSKGLLNLNMAYRYSNGETGYSISDALL